MTGAVDVGATVPGSGETVVVGAGMIGGAAAEAVLFTGAALFVTAVAGGFPRKAK